MLNRTANEVMARTILFGRVVDIRMEPLWIGSGAFGFSADRRFRNRRAAPVDDAVR